MVKIIIPLPPITKKNSQQIIVAGGRPRIIPSKQYLRYEEECGFFIKAIETIDRPVNVACVYYMPTMRRVDLTNLMEATHDILVKYRVLADDNCNIIRSVDGSRVVLGCKDNPRTEIIIEEV